jgi:outer membrane protein OmpA-like peptidoglycan-associated protein
VSVVLGIEAAVVRTGLADFTVRLERGGAPPQSEALALARRFVSALRFGLEAGEPQVLQAARQLVQLLDGDGFGFRPVNDGSEGTPPVRGGDGRAFGDTALSSTARRIEEELLAGRLVVQQGVIATLSERRELFDLELPPLPPARREQGTLNFEVRFIDEVGKAISGIDAEFTADGAQTRATNAAGIAQLEGVQASSANVAILDPEALGKVLEPRWGKFRLGAPPKESNTQEVVFRGSELGPFPLKPEVPNTVVIKPPLGQLFVELRDKAGRVKLTSCDYQIAGPQSFAGKTDADGRLRHEDVLPGDYTLSVALSAFEGTPDAQVDIFESPLVVLEPGSPPQVRAIGAVPRVVMARMRGMTFETNKTFLLPTAVPALKRMRETYEQNPHSQLLIVGHADTTGEPRINDPLSRDRARSMRAYLQDDVDTWLENYDAPGKQKWGTREDRLMISAATDFDLRDPNEDIVEWFQRTRHLKVDGKVGPETRRQLITEYMQLDGVNLIEDQALNLVIESHGAGESFPLDETGLALDQIAVDNVDDVFNRRVELFFFDEDFGIVPAPGAPDGPEYLEWRKRAVENVDTVAGAAQPAPVTLLEVQDTFFRTDSAVVHQNLICPSVFALALKFAQAAPSSRLVIAGHTDTRASDAHNQPLSEERADNALACLVGDRESFVRLSLARHKVADAKQILKFATVKLGFDCDPGALNEDETTLKGPALRFQEQYNTRLAALGIPSATPLDPDGVVGPLTWGAFFDCYEAFLASQVSAAATIDEQLDELEDLRALLAFVSDDEKTIGFGEEYPADRPGVDNVASATNRRVELLFFPQSDLPDLSLPNDISDIYLPGRYRRQALDPCAEPQPPPPPPPPRPPALQQSSIFVRTVLVDGRRVTDVDIFLFDVSVGRSQVGSNFSTTGETDFGPRPPGQYEVDIAKPGFTGGPVVFTVSPNQREVVTVLLTPLGQTEDTHFEVERFTTVFKMVSRQQILALGFPVKGDVRIAFPPSLAGREFPDASGAAAARDAQASQDHGVAVRARVAAIRSQKGAKFVRVALDLLDPVVEEDFSVDKEKTQGGDKSRAGPVTEAELVETDTVTTTIILTTVQN